METIIKNKGAGYKNVLKTQNIILEELKQLKIKITILGSLRHFENLTKKGRKFAQKKGIKFSDVLEND